MTFLPARRSRALPLLVVCAGLGCGGANQNLNQTSITCPPGRTLLDGTCVSEPVADYVACVRAQGAQLGGSKSQQLSAEVGTMGVKAGGAAEVSESLEKKYSASDAAVLEIVRKCAAAFGGPATAPAGPTIEVTKLRSIDTGQPVSLTFTNRRTGSVQLIWIDFEGHEKSYGEIKPGNTMPMNTFVQHVWIARDVVSGAAVWTFSASNQSPKNVEIF